MFVAAKTPDLGDLGALRGKRHHRYALGLAAMLQQGQTLTLLVEKPAVGGRMIARVGGQVVLVGGAVPGERVSARIERVGKGVAYADTVAVDEPSPDRRRPQGDPLCGGCLY